MLISYNWIKKYVHELPEPKELADILTFRLCEVEDLEERNGDFILNLNILPDRAHDLLSHKGVAREIAGMLGLDFLEGGEIPDFEINDLLKTDLKIQVDSNICRRYVGRVVKNIKVEKSPEWLSDRLESIGQRSINNIVDIANYIMFDLGQPVHSFDLDKLESHKIIIRNAKDQEDIDLLGFEKNDTDKQRSVVLGVNDLVIADEKEAIVVAGVKGGIKTAVDENTKNLVLEVANFDPVSIRKTAGKFGIKTDASKRYENEITSEICLLAMNKMSAMIKMICPDALFEEIVDEYPIKPENKTIEIDCTYISKSLGVDLDENVVEKILKNYKYSYERNESLFTIQIPSWRLDIKNKADILEEIGRVYGYDKIESKIPDLAQSFKDSDLWNKILISKNKLIKEGYQEVYTYAFRDKGDTAVMAAASDKSFLRSNIKDGLKESIDLNTKNIPLLDVENVRVFEVGTVFDKNGEKINVAFGDKKNIEEMSLDKFFENIGQNEKDESLKILSFNNEKVFKNWSVYPFMTRDIAVWVPEQTSSDVLLQIYKELGTELLCKEPKLFDSFTKEGRTSYAYRLVFQSKERTLTDEDINSIMADINQKIVSLGFEVR